jgi:adenylate cyclase
MDAPNPSEAFVFGQFRLDRRGGGLFRCAEGGNPAPVNLGSRALDVLGVLIERRGDLVAKDEIMAAVWRGMVVEEANLTVQISALRRVLDADRTGGSCIQTVPRRGYRFVVPALRGEAAPRPLQAPSIDSNTRDDVSGAEAGGSHAVTTPDAGVPADAGLGSDNFVRRRRGVCLAGLLTALCLAIGALVVFGLGDIGWLARPADRPRLSLVVLPFKNLSDDRSEDYLAEGVTDDMTTDLSRVPGMFVIARESAYTYLGKAVDVRKIGEELGVRYVLKGSVRKLGDVLRVNAQLIATETGAHLWADRFDQQLNNLSAGQDAIVSRIGQALNVALVDVESARSKRERPTNPDAFDLVLRARSLFLHPMGPREKAERRALYDQALRLDPTSALAMTGLAVALIQTWRAGDELERAARLLADAAAIDPNLPYVQEATAFLLYAQGRYTESISAYEHLLHDYPNVDPAYNQIAYCLIYTGRAAEAIPMIEAAIRLNPRSGFNWSRYENMGSALLLLGRDEESIVWNQRALAANPNNDADTRAQLNVRLAAAHARLGQLDEAHRAIAEANRIWPYDTVRSHFPQDPSSRVYVEQIERFQAGLRIAGERDHAEEDADFGVAPDDKLHADLAGLTPTTVPGATTIRTAELDRLLADRKPIVIDPLMFSWGRSIPGAVGLNRSGWGGSTSDARQDRLRRKMQELTKGDLSKPIVAVGWNSERFDGRNLALRLVALGYAQVYWYRCGREAWEVNGLREAAVDVQDW